MVPEGSNPVDEIATEGVRGVGFCRTEKSLGEITPGMKLGKGGFFSGR